ncbi:acyltransferase ChoActase/COT/CPT [Phlyctochytrium arcticum]|nr:acyltransferase ChoActase/COT/CPT [Phlyctochytrium arcticum]
MVLARLQRACTETRFRRCFATAPTKTFANQSKLPRLPIPTLENLKEKYLASCEPLLTPKEFEKTKAAVEAFTQPGGFGEELQRRLQDDDKAQKESWLEQIWLDKGYLEWREPSLINVNWWCAFNDHPKHPGELIRKPPPKGVLTTFQINRTAGLITNMLNFKDLIDTEQLPAEYMKDTPLDMHQYKCIFGATRIPGAGKDTISTPWPATARHIIVITKDQIYKVEVIRENGSRVSLRELERLLFAVGQDSLQTSAEPPIGILTAGHRDTWATAHQRLNSLNPQNKENLNTIDEALFAVCLDDTSAPHNIDKSHHQIFHNFDAHNRWFDKALQLIVFNNGRAGVNGEHTPADAVVPGKVFDYIVSNEPACDPANSDGPGLPTPLKLKWVVDEEVETLMKTARKTAGALIRDTQSCLLQTDIYGSRYMKEVAKASPDAYVQLALQLAWRRAPRNGPAAGPTAVYESASTRLFNRGRTETGRSLTKDTWAFVEAFDNDDILYDTKRELFRKALKSQSAYMKEATFGRGIDRHMLGLRCQIANPEEAKKATLFQDPAYLKSMSFRLSTSNMSPGRYFYGGFGCVMPDGYGVNYAIDTDNLKFSISCKTSCKTTDSYGFRDALERTLLDMMILFPTQSEVWGPGWAQKREKEQKEEAYFNIMKKLSDEYLLGRKNLAKKYREPVKQPATKREEPER